MYCQSTLATLSHARTADLPADLSGLATWGFAEIGLDSREGVREILLKREDRGIESKLGIKVWNQGSKIGMEHRDYTAGQNRPIFSSWQKAKIGLSMACMRPPTTVAVQGIVKIECRGTLSFSAQNVAPYAVGLATMASAVNGGPAAAPASSGPGSGSVQAPHTLKMICRTCRGFIFGGGHRGSTADDSSALPSSFLSAHVFLIVWSSLRCHSPRLLLASVAHPPTHCPFHLQCPTLPYLLSLLHDARQVEAREDAPALRERCRKNSSVQYRTLTENNTHLPPLACA